jgi:glycine/D-amino acid oxidase-like deaminating enzyme
MASRLRHVAGPVEQTGRVVDPAFVRTRSFWLDDLDGDDLTPRAPLPGDRQCDVAVVGAGYTGLWTALYLLRRDPTLRVVVLEAQVAGFGASGRNGGWCSALLPMGYDSLAASHGHGGAVAMRRAMIDTVAEVGRAAADEGIDCDFAPDGYLSLARSPAHVARLHERVADEVRYGATADDVRWLERDEARSMVAAQGVLGGVLTRACAAIQPARLVRGLARAVEQRGGVIHEGTPVRAIERGRAVTDHGTVRAEVVVRATEGFTPKLGGERRTLAPLYSLMIATEPLPVAAWDEIGWSRRCTLNDARQLIIYGQRTARGRIAFGGRGAPYHFGSKIEPGFDRDPRVFAALHQTLRELFPTLDGIAITHQWGGPLGVPRDWHCSVGLDRSAGLAWAGGYVGDGVGTTNLAGRTLADLITGTTSELTALPWVGHSSRRWEPEPLRWLGINAGLRLPASIDAHEVRTGRPAPGRAWALRRLSGGH